MLRERHTPAQDPGPAGLTLPELASAAGVPAGALWHAQELGLLPPPDAAGGRWSAAAAQALQLQWPGLAAALQAAQELGAQRCAQLLSRATGLAVRSVHVQALADRGLLAPSRAYRHRPLYRVADVQALADDPLGRAVLWEIVG
jgi:hypothetical protein